jgi:hypothetical protein
MNPSLEDITLTRSISGHSLPMGLARMMPRQSTLAAKKKDRVDRQFDI